MPPVRSAATPTVRVSGCPPGAPSASQRVHRALVTTNSATPPTTRMRPATCTSTDPRWPSSPSQRCSSSVRSIPHSTMAVPRTAPLGAFVRGEWSGHRPRWRSSAISRQKTEKSSSDWMIGTGIRLADLTGVVHAEPLVRRVATASHHQLGSEQAPHRPGRQQDRGNDVEGPADGELGAAPARHQRSRWAPRTAGRRTRRGHRARRRPRHRDARGSTRDWSAHAGCGRRRRPPRPPTRTWRRPSRSGSPRGASRRSK